MTACPPLLVLTIRTFFFSAAMALTLNEERERRLEDFGRVSKEGEMEREKERLESEVEAE